jgi:hypothetical protein
MFRISIVTIAIILISSVLKSQTIENQGKPIAEIFTDFHYSLRREAYTTGFSVNRAYFGYNYIADQNLSATIIVQIGTPEDLASGSKPRRYAYYREASISYQKDKLSLSLGITGTRIFDFQQKFWGKRYIAITFEELNGYGVNADLGLVMDYKFNNYIKADFSLVNGEGYSNIQLDNNLKTCVGFTITPVKILSIRLYGDLIKPLGIWQSTLVGFVGLKNERFTIGSEVSHKSNLDLINGHNAWGISSTGSFNISKKSEVFVRYDYSTSANLPGDTIKFNYKKDGQFLIAGLQHTLNKNVKLALDYQCVFPADKSKSVSKMIYLNATVKF